MNPNRNEEFCKFRPTYRQNCKNRVSFTNHNSQVPKFTVSRLPSLNWDPEILTMASRMEEEEQEEEGEIEVFSDSDSAKSDGGEEADEDYHDGSDEEEGGGEDYLPSDQERKSQNVADLVR